MATAKPTLKQVRAQMEETFRKWGYQKPVLEFIVDNRQVGKWQDQERRRATVRFRKNLMAREYVIHMALDPVPIENALLLAKAFEHVRMAEYRGIAKLTYGILNFWYGGPTPPPPPPREAPRAASSGPYATLHIADGAPLEIAEAAFKVLARKHHPDVGGSTATMQALNAAIEAIRKKTAK